MANITPNNLSPSNRTNMVTTDDNREVEKKWPTNAKWIVNLLALVVLLLIARILTNFIYNGDNLLHAIENFSTILSIFLSVSSIAFAGYTSIETGRQYHSMTKAVKEIETSSKLMSENYRDLLKHYHDTVKDFSTQMSNGYGGQNNQIRNNEPAITGIKGNTTASNTPPQESGNITGENPQVPTSAS